MGGIKILFVIDHLGGGGAERQFLNLVNNIDRDRFETVVFICEKKGVRFSELRSSIKKFGRLKDEERKTLISILELRSLINRWKPHIIQTWLDYSAFVSAIALRVAAHKPVFLASHRTSAEEIYSHEVSLGRLKKKALIWTYRQTGTVTTNTKVLIEQLKGYGVKNPLLIYNGIDIDYLKSLPSKAALREKLGFDHSFYIVFAGSLVRRKGIYDLLNAFKQIPDKHIRLIVLGDGAEKQHLITLASDDNRIVFTGYKANAVEYIKASDLLVLPSIYEGLPNVVIESMAVETPVIATSVYGMNELIEDNVNGFLVNAGNIQVLKDAIIKSINNPDILKQFRERSFERAKFFDIKRMVKEYEELYSTVVAL